MAETTTTWSEIKNDEACCGMLVSQIGYEWLACPYCGSHFDSEIMHWSDYFGMEMV